MHALCTGGFWARLALLFFISGGPAYAYLDPGSGSYILQLLLGGVAGIAVLFKLYWNQFLAFFGVLRASNSPPMEDKQNSESDAKE